MDDSLSNNSTPVKRAKLKETEDSPEVRAFKQLRSTLQTLPARIDNAASPRGNLFQSSHSINLWGTAAKLLNILFTPNQPGRTIKALVETCIGAVVGAIDAVVPEMPLLLQDSLHLLRDSLQLAFVPSCIHEMDIRCSVCCVT